VGGRWEEDRAFIDHEPSRSDKNMLRKKKGFFLFRAFKGVGKGVLKSTNAILEGTNELLVPDPLSSCRQYLWGCPTQAPQIRHVKGQRGGEDLEYEYLRQER
jgi:hypothetical protein